MNLQARIIPVCAAIAALTLTTTAATNQFGVTASGFSDYTINDLPDPELTLVRGFTYFFNVDAPIHPFYITTTFNNAFGRVTWDDGVTNQGATVGTVTFAVPNSAPDTLYYQCGAHNAMWGVLNIIDPPGVIITDVNVGSNVVIKSTGYDSDKLNLNVLSSTNLTTNTVWSSASILSNVFDSGTNTTTVTLPAGDAAFFQVQQGFF